MRSRGKQLFFAVLLASNGSASERETALHVPLFCENTLKPAGPIVALPSPLSVPTPLPGTVDAVAIVIPDRGRWVLGLRQGNLGEGTWAFVGGKLDPGESIQRAAQREAREEIGAELKNFRMLMIDEHELSGQRFRTFVVFAELRSTSPTIREPEKMKALGFFPPDKLPDPLFKPVENYLPRLREALKNQALQ